MLNRYNHHQRGTPSFSYYWYDIVGFYGYPSSWDKNVRKSLIQKLDRALSSENRNYVLGDFNFTESQLDRNRPNKNTIENNKHLNENWEKIRDEYELVDSFRILNPKLRGYFLMSNIARDPEYIAYTSPRLKVERFTRTKFFMTPWNDHKIYKINVFDNIDIGPGQWALNINLLRDRTFRKTLEKRID